MLSFVNKTNRQYYVNSVHSFISNSSLDTDTKKNYTKIFYNTWKDTVATDMYNECLTYYIQYIYFSSIVMLSFLL